MEEPSDAELDETIDFSAASESMEVVKKEAKNGKGRRRPSLTTKMPSKKKQKPSKTTEESLQERLIKARAEVKVDFEEKKQEILAAYPSDLKNRFGEIGFTKWNGKVYACIILNPYNVAPGEVRRKFEESFEKLKKQDRLEDLPYLVYFYGEQSLNSMYSFILKNKFVSYEEGVGKKNHLQPLLASRKKLQENKKLTKIDDYNLRALAEIEEDLMKDKTDRRQFTFPEVYDLLSETDLLEDESDDSDSESDSESASDHPSHNQQPEKPAPMPKVAKKKPSPQKKQKKPQQERAASDTVPSNQQEPVVMQSSPMNDDDNFSGNADDEDEANLQYALGDSDNDGGDSEDDVGWREARIMDGHSSRGKSKTGKSTDALKRQGSQTRTKELTPSEAEKRDFVRCEKLYRPLVQAWETALLQQDFVALKDCFEQATVVVSDCSAPFLEVYFADLVKRTKSLLRDSPELGSEHLFASIKVIGKNLKELYNEKKTKVPPGFKTPKIKPFRGPLSVEPLGTQLSLAVAENDRSDEVESNNSHRRSDPRKVSSRVATSLSPVRSSHVPVSAALSRKRLSAPFENNSGSADMEDATAPKPDRQAFSLGKLKTRVEPQPVIAAVQAQSDTANPSSLPRWLTTPAAAAFEVDNTDRALALEFLHDASNESFDETVLADTVARAIEVAIYNWATRVGTSLDEAKRKEEHTQLELSADIDPLSNEDTWVDLYWNRVHAIVGAVAGSKGNGTGTLVPLIMSGSFPTAESLVCLSDEQLAKSFIGVAIY